MVECSYAKEPFDLRLMMLRLLKRWRTVVFLTLAGIVIFGGGYYVKNVIMGPKDTYGVQSTYSVEYATDPKTNDICTYINAVTWNTWVHTDEFLTSVEHYLDREIDREVLSGYLSADLPSDLRMPTTLVVTPDPQLSVEIAQALEQSFLDFADRQKEIDKIRVVDPAVKAEKVLLDVRPLRACILSGITTFFLTITVLGIWEAGGDCLWLPAQLTRRYGVKSLGSVKNPYFAENIFYLIGKAQKVGVVCVGGNVTLEMIEALQNGWRRSNSQVQQEIEEPNWSGVPSLEEQPQECRKLRNLDAIILVVPAGIQKGKKLEAVLELLQTQDLNVSAALLWNADEWLIRSYYRCATIVERP